MFYALGYFTVGFVCAVLWHNYGSIEKEAGAMWCFVLWPIVGVVIIIGSGLGFVSALVRFCARKPQ